MSFDGTVRIDAKERELVVKPASDARPLAKYLWGETVRTMAEESARHWQQSAPTPWASGAGQERLCYGIPDRDGSLRFRPGDPSYTKLVSTPGLSARIVLDRTSGRISVLFRGRR
jgi:hypothetical protein